MSLQCRFIGLLKLSFGWGRAGIIFEAFLHGFTLDNCLPSNLEMVIRYYTHLFKMNEQLIVDILSSIYSLLLMYTLSEHLVWKGLHFGILALYALFCLCHLRFCLLGISSFSACPLLSCLSASFLLLVNTVIKIVLTVVACSCSFSLWHEHLCQQRYQHVCND